MVVAPLVKEGLLDGTCANGRYVPNSYVRAQQDALVERLRLEGVLGMFWVDRSRNLANEQLS